MLHCRRDQWRQGCVDRAVCVWGLGTKWPLTLKDRLSSFLQEQEERAYVYASGSRRGPLCILLHRWWSVSVEDWCLPWLFYVLHCVHHFWLVSYRLANVRIFFSGNVSQNVTIVLALESSLSLANVSSWFCLFCCDITKSLGFLLARSLVPTFFRFCGTSLQNSLQLSLSRWSPGCARLSCPSLPCLSTRTEH